MNDEQRLKQIAASAAQLWRQAPSRATRPDIRTLSATKVWPLQGILQEPSTYSLQMYCGQQDHGAVPPGGCTPRAACLVLVLYHGRLEDAADSPEDHPIIWG